MATQISLTFDNQPGATGSTGPAGPEGPQGIQGAMGPTGVLPTLSIWQGGATAGFTINISSGGNTVTGSDLSGMFPETLIGDSSQWQPDTNTYVPPSSGVYRLSYNVALGGLTVATVSQFMLQIYPDGLSGSSYTLFAPWTSIPPGSIMVATSFDMLLNNPTSVVVQWSFYSTDADTLYVYAEDSTYSIVQIST